MCYSKTDTQPSPHDSFYQSYSYYLDNSHYIYVAINSLSSLQSHVIDYNQINNFQILVLDDNVTASTPYKPITTSQLHRLHNAAKRISLDIIIVGSRANGTAKDMSDWDYIIEKLNNRKWKKVKNSMPGAKTKDSARNIDIVRIRLDVSKPHIIVRFKDSLEKILGYGRFNYIITQ